MTAATTSPRAPSCVGRYALDLPLVLGIRLALALVSFGLSVYLGPHGNEIAWRSRQWVSPAAFAQTQRRWTLVLFCIVAAVSLLQVLIVR